VERKHRVASAVLVCLTLLSCSAKVAAQKAGSSVVVSIFPPAAEVQPGETVQLRATVTGSSVTTVHWSIREPGSAGSVSADGLYTAPASVGVYHVLATSDADPRAVGVVAVTVTATPVLAVYLSPRSVSVPVNGTVAFVAAVTGATAGQSTAVTWEIQEGSPAGGTIANGTYTAPSSTGTFHVIARSVADTTKFDTATVGVTPPGAFTPASWVMGYWSSWTWEWNTNGPPRFDGTALTHVAVAHALTTAAGGMTYGYGLSQLATSNTDRAIPGTATDLLRSQTIVSQIHAAGAKAVLMIGGSDDPNWLSATNDTNRATFVATILSYVDAAQWDGIDLDWENGYGNPQSVGFNQMAALARDLRTARPGLFIAVPLNNWGAGAQATLLAPYVDQLNVMTYDDNGDSGRTWYHSGLYSPGAGGSTGWSADAGVEPILAASGVTASKVGIGIAFYGYRYPGTGLTGPGQAAGGRVAIDYSAIVGDPTYFNTSAATYAWDATAKGAATYSAANWIGYEDEALIREKAAYVRAKGMGGAIIWLVGQSAFNQGGGIWRNPLLEAVKREFLGRAPAPTPRAGTASFSTGGGSGSGTITIAGLTQSYVWWDRQVGASGFDLRANPANAGWSDGIPTAYVIEGSTNGGTSWSTLTTVTGNTYVTRMHAVNLTGMNRVRMRLTGPTHDGVDGTVDLAVHDASAGSGDDAWLFIGDSLTSNIFDGVLGLGRFGGVIAARDAARYPVVLNGGVDGGLISQSLRTDWAGSNGDPLIRQWMRDFPGKYVALQLLTNDINQAAWNVTISPATLDGWQAQYEQQIKEVIAGGKTPILPRMRWTNTQPYTGAWIAAWNARITNVIHPKYPQTILGPDLYANSYNHPELLSDGTHVTDAGAIVTQTDWANWVVTTIYAPPAP
jgi:GH18 family chitinase